MEVDGVRHRVGCGIDERHFDIIPLMHDHERPGNRTIVGHAWNGCAELVNDDWLFLGRQLELNDFWTRFGDLVMGMHERRRDKRDALAWKVEISFGPRRRR